MSTWAAVVFLVLAIVAIRQVSRGRRAPRDEVERRIRAGATVVDVRSPDEFRRGAYPGAINIPLPTMGARLAEIPVASPVVLYCASGIRSGHAANLLRRAGFSDVVNAGALGDMPPPAR